MGGAKSTIYSAVGSAKPEKASRSEESRHTGRNSWHGPVSDTSANQPESDTQGPERAKLNWKTVRIAFGFQPPDSSRPPQPSESSLGKQRAAP
ncbi:hypothetical protein M407DRAFT_243306 [Tulasnella calospora MUT 4182]|uniref:Uncharacterized protein n=1 Tax=Tulasnella calospora MUT 4182 TaxID=1051891 RepID=A0A0C3QLJ4_9AGAM|nr:hypothetical protein M407DRAFT_243306 [Tulasnella calospora MUT 4182]